MIKSQLVNVSHKKLQIPPVNYETDVTLLFWILFQIGASKQRPRLASDQVNLTHAVGVPPINLTPDMDIKELKKTLKRFSKLQNHS